MLITTPKTRAPTLLEPGHRLAQLVAGGLAVPRHDDRAVGGGGDDGRVRDRQQRRRVDDDHVEVVAEPLQQVVGDPGLQDLGRVGRLGAAGQEVQPARLVDLDRVLQLGGADQHAGEPDRPVEVEQARHPRPAQVAVDQQHVAARLGEGHCEVGRGHRLALARHGAGDDQAARLLLQVEELQVGPQQPERLGAGREGAEVGEQRALLDLVVEADAGEHRRAADLLDVLQAAHRAVEDVAGDGQADAEHQPDHAGHHQVQQGAGRDRVLPGSRRGR